MFILEFILLRVFKLIMLPWTYRVEWKCYDYYKTLTPTGKTIEMNYFDAQDQFIDLSDGAGWSEIHIYSTNKFTGKSKWVRRIKW